MGSCWSVHPGLCILEFAKEKISGQHEISFPFFKDGKKHFAPGKETAGLTLWPPLLPLIAELLGQAAISLGPQCVRSPLEECAGCLPWRVALA